MIAMEGLTMNMIPTMLRVRRRLRMLDSAYMASEDKQETRTVVQAQVNELKMIHELLPSTLREKSWILTIERHGTW